MAEGAARLERGDRRAVPLIHSNVCEHKTYVEYEYIYSDSFRNKTQENSFNLCRLGGVLIADLYFVNLVIIDDSK